MDAVRSILVGVSLACALFGVADAASKARAGKAARAPSGVPGSVYSAISASGLPVKSFGFFAQEVGSDRTLAALNEETPYMMASTTKVVTSLAALDLLGPYYRWRTSAFALGPIVRGKLLGDLLIVGGGNAQLTSAELQAWFSRMHAQGLEEIQGDIVLDRFAFDLSDSDHIGTPVQSAYRPRHVWPAALTLDEGQLGVTLQPARGKRPALGLVPTLSDVTLVNQVTSGGACAATARWEDTPGGRAGQAQVIVRGSWGTTCGTRTISFVPPPHSGYAARALPAMWAKTGGTLGGRVVANDRPIGDKALPVGIDGEVLQPLSFDRSKPLPELVRDINKTSDNMAARNLMLSLSPGFPERPATWQEGDAALEQFVLADGGAHDEELLQLFHRRYLRYKLLCGPEGSAMARHEPIQKFRS